MIDWTRAERGRFYRLTGSKVTLRIDADPLAWFKSKGARYQTRINEALRRYVEEHRKTG